MGVNGCDGANPPPGGEEVASDSNTGAELHVASSGPYRRKSIVAPSAGARRPMTIALSVSVPAPSTMSGEAVVTRLGVTRATTVVSPASPQAPATGALFASPPEDASQRYRRA